MNKITCFCLLLLVGCKTPTTFSYLVGEDEPKETPNIIFILTDDQRWDAIGVSGNDVIQTPAMDQLASEGAYFKKAFVTTPICAASRASILTGLHERTHNYTFGHGKVKPAYLDIAYPKLMREAGYHTGFLGKSGVAYDDSILVFDAYESFDRNNEFDDRRGYFYKKIGNETVHLTRYTGHKAQEFIKDAPKDKPFCLSVSFSAPHAHDSAEEQYFWQEKSNERYANVTFDAPPLSEDKYFDALPEEVRDGFNRTRWHWRYDTPEKYQNSMRGYYTMISEIDDELAEIRTLLEEKGIADNTIIILMGDNGYYQGERQLAGKWLMHDNSIRVPLIVYDPRVKKSHTVNDMVLNIDVTKTILDIAGVKAPDAYQGISLLPYAKAGMSDEKRQSILVEHLWELVNIPASEGIRSDTWKYFRYIDIEAPEELYNLEKDPMEINNLAADPVYRRQLYNFKRELDYLSNKYHDAKLVSDFVDPTLMVPGKKKVF